MDTPATPPMPGRSPGPGRPVLGSVLLGTSDPERLRAWYCAVLAPDHHGEGFIDFGGTELLIDGRSDLRARNTEPGRTILNFHVADAQAMEDRLVAMDAIWIRELERTPSGHIIGTVLDPDGNYVQIIQSPDPELPDLPDRPGGHDAGQAAGSGSGSGAS